MFRIWSDLQTMIGPKFRLQPLAAATSLFALTVAAQLSGATSTATSPAAAGAIKQNILFVILDDIGADQLCVSNPAGCAAGTLPLTPTIDAIAAQGVNFTNCWAMPECSPSRVCFFTGRYPSRTNVGAPLIPYQTLAQSQCSPFETTTPMLLEPLGFTTALFGKYHLAHNDFNPAGPSNLVPDSNGFTHFIGTMLASPPPIDMTLAGQLSDPADKLYSCGFPVVDNAPAVCACQYQDGTCLSGIEATECLKSGGVPLVRTDGSPIFQCDGPDADNSRARIEAATATGAATETQAGWDLWNGYYVWPRTVNEDGVANDDSLPASKYFRANADLNQSQDAINFIKAQKAKGSSSNWMCTLSFSGDHTPLQSPPTSSVNSEWPTLLPYACGAQSNIEHDQVVLAAQRKTSDHNIESLDTRIRTVLLETGLAHESKSGALVLDASDTLIVVMGDNGSFLTTVKLPFTPLRSKSTIYQTGVCVPLVMAGGPTIAPGRAVDHMVNAVDLFQLWGEIAGINVHDAVPAGRKLDCFPMLGYLTNPKTPSYRSINFAEYFAPKLFVEAESGTETCGPCLLQGGEICTDTFLASELFCTLQGGVWYGEGSTKGEFASCCEILAAPGGEGAEINSILFPAAQTITDGRWKLLSRTVPCPDAIATRNYTLPYQYEFYDLPDCPFANILFGRGIDNDSANLLLTGNAATDLKKNPEALAAYNKLLAQLQVLNDSFIAPVGDITLDGSVNAHDLAAMFDFWAESSVADLNNDAKTDGKDLAILLNNWDESSK